MSYIVPFVWTRIEPFATIGLPTQSAVITELGSVLWFDPIRRLAWTIGVTNTYQHFWNTHDFRRRKVIFCWPTTKYCVVCINTLNPIAVVVVIIKPPPSIYFVFISTSGTFIPCVAPRANILRNHSASKVEDGLRPSYLLRSVVA